MNDIYYLIHIYYIHVNQPRSINTRHFFTARSIVDCIVPCSFGMVLASKKRCKFAASPTCTRGLQQSSVTSHICWRCGPHFVSTRNGRKLCNCLIRSKTSKGSDGSTLAATISCKYEASVFWCKIRIFHISRSMLVPFR